MADEIIGRHIQKTGGQMRGLIDVDTKTGSILPCRRSWGTPPPPPATTPLAPLCQPCLHMHDDSLAHGVGVVGEDAEHHLGL